MTPCPAEHVSHHGHHSLQPITVSSPDTRATLLRTVASCPKPLIGLPMHPLTVAPRVRYRQSVPSQDGHGGNLSSASSSVTCVPHFAHVYVPIPGFSPVFGISTLLPLVPSIGSSLLNLLRRITTPFCSSPSRFPHIWGKLLSPFHCNAGTCCFLGCQPSRRAHRTADTQ